LNEKAHSEIINSNRKEQQQKNLLPPINLNKRNNIHFNLYLNKPIAHEKLDTSEYKDKREENFSSNQFETSLMSFNESSYTSNEFSFKYITSQFESTSLSLKAESKPNNQLINSTNASSCPTWIVLDTMKNGDIFVFIFNVYSFCFG
jgi:hypothetical protein